MLSEVTPQDKQTITTALKAPMLSLDQESELLCLYQQTKRADLLAKIVKSFDKLVVAVAMKYRFYGLPMADLIQEGRAGLLKAIHHFDSNMHQHFAAYAKWWIKADIQDYVYKNWSLVRASATQAHRILFFQYHYLREKSALEGDAWAQLTPQDIQNITKKLNVLKKDIENIEDIYKQSIVSLTPHDNGYISDTLKELHDLGRTPEEEALYIQEQLLHSQFVDVALKCLNPRQAFVIAEHRLRDPARTFEEIAIDLGLSKERVRQIELSGFKKIREEFNKNNIEFNL